MSEPSTGDASAVRPRRDGDAADAAEPVAAPAGVGAALAPRRRGGGTTLRGRPTLYTDYAADQAIWNTKAKLVWTLVIVVGALVLPFFVSRDLQTLFTTVFIVAIGGIGLNLVTGYAGQVSLGHAFFLGIGAYTAAFFGGEETMSACVASGWRCGSGCRWPASSRG
jgi:hypothetical protein